MYDYVFFTDVTDTVIIYKAIGVYKLAHELRKKGKKCLVVDHLHAWAAEEIKSLLDLAISKKTLAIGFSNTFFKNSNVDPNSDGSITYGHHYPDNLFPQGKEYENEIISYIKIINPAIKIILGGANARRSISNKNVDIVITGFAESSIMRLDARLESKNDFSRIEKNIWGVAVIDDDKTASDFIFSENSFQWLDTDVVNHKLLDLEVSRGCIFKCTFCSYPLIGKKKNDYIKPASLLADELRENWERYGVKDYYILDDTFNDNNVKIDSILDAVKKLDFQPSFWAYTRLDLLTTQDQIDKLYDIGLRSMYFGIETLNPKTAKLIKKGFDRNRQIKTVQHIKSKYPNIRMHGSFILGLPEESIDSVTETFNLCQTQELPLHTYSFKPLQLSLINDFSWNSELDREYEKFGYKSTGIDQNTGLRYWANSYTDIDEVSELAKKFSQESTTSEHFKIPGQLAFGLKNYGFSDSYLFNTKYKDLDWHEVSLNKIKFIDEYKKKLLHMIRTTSDIT